MRTVCALLVGMCCALPAVLAGEKEPHKADCQNDARIGHCGVEVPVSRIDNLGDLSVQATDAQRATPAGTDDLPCRMATGIAVPRDPQAAAIHQANQLVVVQLWPRSITGDAFVGLPVSRCSENGRLSDAEPLLRCTASFDGVPCKLAEQDNQRIAR